MYTITDDVEEAFFDAHFEYGDGMESMNAEKAKQIYHANCLKAEELAELIENGEIFDRGEAVLTFQNIALSKKFFREFTQNLPDNVLT